MSIEVSAGWIWLTLLCTVRLVPLFAFTPLLSGFPVPHRVKVLLLLTLACSMVSMSSGGPPPPPGDLASVLRALAGEVLLGAIMGFGVHAAFAAYSLAGGVMDVQMGFAIGTVFDPVSRRASPLLASALGTMAITSFFSLDLHHDVLRAFASGLQSAPPGSGLQPLPMELIVDRFGSIFVFGLSMAAPVVFLLFLLDVGMAVMSRSIPQLNVLFLGMPVKIVLGVGLLALLLPHWSPVLSRVMRDAFGR